MFQIGNIIQLRFQWRIQDFPKEGAPTLGGAPTYNFAKFSQKLHEIERIWTPRGVARPLLDLYEFCSVQINSNK